MKSLSLILKEIPSSARLELREYLLETLGELKNIDNVYKGLNPIKAIIDLRASQKAYSFLSVLLEEIIEFTVHKDKDKDARDSFEV